LDIDSSAAFNYFEENSEVSSTQNQIGLNSTQQKENSSSSESLVAFHNFVDSGSLSGFEAVLGGELCEKAIWVDESTCIGCRYCVHVATNTFLVDEDLGRCRVIRQNGDDVDIVQEAIDTCPVDCIHWVDFEDLDMLEKSLNRDMFQSLGKLPRVNRY
tara:strand:+ start:657 stop:1130 length:474 start_codon:yes stop_codon:yes gene_type:complete